MSKKVLFMILTVSLFTGCASLKTQVFETVKPGQARYEVIHNLGEPDSFTRNSLTYIRRSDICTVVITDAGVVADIACEHNPNYVNPIAAGLRGMSEGMRNHQRTQIQPVTCRKAAFGYGETYNCE